MMVVFPDKIREEQIDSLVYADITSTKLQPLDLSETPQTIAKSKAISVLFCVPNGKEYEALLALFNDSKKMEELNRPIYFYPLVYEVEETKRRYNIDSSQPTVIFFKDGKEANRLTISQREEKESLAQAVIPELNRLPLVNIKKLEDELANETATSTKITEEQLDSNSSSNENNTTN